MKYECPRRIVDKNLSEKNQTTSLGYIGEAAYLILVFSGYVRPQRIKNGSRDLLLK